MFVMYIMNINMKPAVIINSNNSKTQLNPINHLTQCACQTQPRTQTQTMERERRCHNQNKCVSEHVLFLVFLSDYICHMSPCSGREGALKRSNRGKES